jgi:glycosyltransferase involved in cell wall biosynthesis
VTSETPVASVAIVTKDRRDILRDALSSIFGQTVTPEVLVLDDGSTDGTGDLVRKEFPKVRLFRAAVPRGPCAQRTALARLASGPIIVFFDDDVVLESSHTLELTLGNFDHDRVGAVAIPYMEAHEAPHVRHESPASEPAYATFPFVAVAYAARREALIRIGGFRADLFAQAEEPDLCLRMLAAGLVTRLGTAPPLLHLGSPPYDLDAKVFLGTRNQLLYAWRNVPMPYLPVRLVTLLARAAFDSARFREPGAAVRGLTQGLRRIASGKARRQPVGRGVYRLAHALKTRRAVPLPEIEGRLPRLTEP